MDMSIRQTFLVIFGAILLFGLVLTFPLYKSVLDDYASRIAFDQTSWLAGNDRDAYPKRTQMIDDLISNNDFHGKSKAEVMTMLGEPTSTEYFSDWDMIYWLGPERGIFSIDDEWLILRFNERSVVIDYKVITD